MTAHVNGLL